MPFRRSRGAGKSSAADVERAIKRVALEDTPENRTELYELLLKATLLAATPDGPARSRSRIAERAST